MATTTYVPLITQTLNSSASSVTLGSGGTISQAYTDLVLVCSLKGDTTSETVLVQCNGDTATNYSYTLVYGTGSATGSQRYSNQTAMRIGSTDTSANYDVYIANFQNYSNSTTYKSVLSRESAASNLVSATIGLWRSTSAITSIKIFRDNSTNFVAGSTFTLYGIVNADTGALATGGVITYDSTYYYHTFGSSGTFTPKQSLTADILVVAGGGGGSGGGGGAGGLLGFASQSLTATGYTVTVGSGGAGQNNIATNGSNGGDSQFGALTLVKGGGGGAQQAGGGAGQNGGSGGGGAYASATGSPTSGQGNAGGGSTTSGERGNGGGGGAGAAGTAGTTSGGGAGGNGSSSYSSYGIATGTGQNVNGTVYYAGGGGGGNFSSNSSPDINGVGGYGGGGNAPLTLKTAGVSGLVNTGGGGSSGYIADGNKPAGGNGGSGIVIIRYPKA